MAKGHKQSDLQNLPGCACEFIEMVIRKMRYRKILKMSLKIVKPMNRENKKPDS